ncbi:SGNH/GDSL hydrolase family protein [Qipengyuania sp. ASV99]|uniref:SGNH/GDSL hydrolase family protein n=1 Tax=Qipengyuania sp. ASV99 TaxID=3399681 RepID=UPI003A4C540A
MAAKLNSRATLGNLVFCIALLIAAVPALASEPQHWTRAWTSSVWQGTQRHTLEIENATIRMEIRSGAAGKAIRLRLSNEYGDDPLTIGAVTVRRANGQIARANFDGAPTATIWQRTPLISDPVDLPVDAFELVQVAIYFPDETSLSTVHGVRGEPTLVSAKGDHTASSDFPVSKTHAYRPVLAGLDVLGSTSRPVIVAFGDSITDNVGCANAAPIACRWGEVLGRRLAATDMPHVVITQAIGANRVLRGGVGPSALARFDRDVLAVPGVSHVILLEGINDIGNSGPENPLKAGDLIRGYRQLIARAHEAGIKVYGSPILPWRGASRYTDEREAIRAEVNRWILTSGEFDAVIRLDTVVADQSDPSRLAAPLQLGDNLHPNGEGETAMGNFIDLDLFR